MKDCPEVLETDRFGSVTPILADNCASRMTEPEASQIADAVRSVPDIRWQLNAVTADLNQKMLNARKLSDEAGRLKQKIEAAQ